MSQKNWYSIHAPQAKSKPLAHGERAFASDNHAEVFIYGDIGESFWEETVAAKDFVREIAALDVERITLRINSYGGSVSDGIAIYNAIKRHNAHVTAEIDGVAYSIASLIAIAADSVNIASNALMMVHMPHTVTWGNAKDHDDAAGVLRQYASAMKTSYLARGIDAAAVDEWFSNGQDYFFTAQEALDVGLVDNIGQALPISQSAAPSACALREQQTFAKVRYAAFARFGAPSAVLNHSPVNQSVAQHATKNEGVSMPQNVGQEGVQSQQAASHPNEQIKDSAAQKDIEPHNHVDARAVLQAEAQRRRDIRAAFEPFAQRADVAALAQRCEDDVQCSVVAARSSLLDLLGSKASPVASYPHVQTLQDETDVQRNLRAQALLARAGLEKTQTDNPYRGTTLLESARASAERTGVRGGDKLATVGAAFTHSTSDFPALLEDVARRALHKGYEEAAETFPLWTSTGTLSDFRPAKRVGLGIFDNLLEVPEGAEFKYGTFGENAQSVVLATYGRLFSITRQAIINDDLGVFVDVPRKMGRAAHRTIGDMVYNVLLGAPIMDETGKELFHKDHDNILPAAAISTSSVDAMQSTLALQEKLGVVLNTTMKYLIVPRTQLGLARTVLTSQFAYEPGSSNNTIPNSVRDTFEIIADARLDKVDKKAWYGLADPNIFETIQVNYLDGNATPYLEQKQGWTVDGTEYKVRIDAGVAPLDYRGLAKNPGK